MSEQLNIQVVENGFIVSEGGTPGYACKQHVFNNHSELGDFVASWGSDNSKPAKPRAMKAE